VVRDDLHVGAVRDQLALHLELVVVGLGVLSEAVLSADSHLLSARELEHRPSESLLGVLHVLMSGSDGNNDISDGDSSGLSVGLAPSASHALLESIGASTGKHLVDSDDVPGVDSGPHVEALLSALVLHVFVAGDTGGFEGLGADLLLLAGDQVDAHGELVVAGLLLSDIVNSNLGVRHSTTVARLGVGLVFLVPVAASWSSSHLYIK